MDFILRTSSVKASSITILSVLLLSALVGALALAPTVKAATPTLTLSTTSGTSTLGAADPISGTDTIGVATLVTVTGTGFPGGQDSIAVGYITLSKSITAANFNQLQLIRPSLASSSTTSGDVQADANGWFTAQFYVPEIQAGTYQIVAQYTPNAGTQTLTTGASFTVNAAVAVFSAYTLSTGGIYNQRVGFAAAGFQASETVSTSPTTAFVTASYGGTGYSGFAVGNNGATCSSPNVNTGRCGAGTNQTAWVNYHKSGVVTIVGTGGTSSISASSTYTFNPSIAVLTSAGVTTFSISTAAGSAKIEGFNFASAATFNANSLTINVGTTTASTIMNSVTTATNGYFVPTTFTWTQSLPEGLATIGLNGTTYSWANANIQPTATFGWQMSHDGNGWYGVLISSSTSGPAFLQTDSSSYTLGAEPFIFGIGFSGSAVTATTYQPTGSSASALTVDTLPYTGTQQVTADGAFAITPTGGGVLPYSYGANNLLSATAGSTGTTTVTITPNIYAPSSSSYSLSSGQSGSTPFNRQLRNAATGLEVKGFSEATNGFGNPDSAFTVTLTSSAGVVTTWATISASTTSCAGYTPSTSTANMCVNNSPGDYKFYALTVPELAGGSYTLTITGTTSGNTATLGTSMTPIVIGAALSITGGTPGTTASFATSTTSGGQGVHGLNPSTSYSVMFDGPTGTSVGTFTSTANGEVPPGTQFALPAGATGTHVVDLVAAGTTTSAISGAIAPRAQLSAQYTGYTAPVTTTSTSNTSTQGLTLSLTGSGTLSPNVGFPGTVVSVSASGLTPSTAYYVVLYNDISYASFTSTASGTVPAGTTFTFPNVPVAAGKETGDAFGVRISSTALHTGSGVAANATFILQSNLKLSANTATPGQTLTLTASALANGQAYSVIFDYAVTSSGNSFNGVTVGSLVGGTDGTATGQFTVPSGAASGSHTIQLIRTGTTGIPASLSVAPTLTVNSSPTGIGTSTLTASGGATEAAVNGQATVSQTFTNTASGPLSVYMWVSVTNSAGQTVGVFLGSATIAAGATTPIGAALFNLPSGTYTATVFVTTTSGIVVSSTSTTSSFSV